MFTLGRTDVKQFLFQRATIFLQEKAAHSQHRATFTTVNLNTHNPIVHPQTAHQATYIVFHEICKAPTMILTVHHRLQAISYHSVEVYKATRVIIVIHTTQATAHVQNLFPGFVNVNSFVLRNAVEMLLMIKNYIVHVTHKSQYHLKHKNSSAVPVHLIATLTA